MPFRVFLKLVYIQSNIRIYSIGMSPMGFLCAISSPFWLQNPSGNLETYNKYNENI